MSQDPRDTWRRLTRAMAKAQQQGRMGGSPRGALGGAAGLILLVGGVTVASNALFNGMGMLPCLEISGPNVRPS